MTSLGVNARQRSGWIFVLATAMAVRAGVLAARYDRLRADPDGYRALATGLNEYGTYGYPVADAATGGVSVRPTAFRPPAYPLLVALAGRVFGHGPLAVAILHWLLGVGTVALVCVLGRQWGLGRWRWAAALAVACDPILLNQSALVMSETLAALLAALGLVCLSRCSGRLTAREAAGAGAALGAASLCRPAFLPWLVLSAAVLLVGAPGRARRRWAPAAALVLAAAAVLAPWALRNWFVIGRPVVATTHGGYTLLLGNNPEFYAFLQTGAWGDVWDSCELDRWYNRVKEQCGHDELLADRRAYRRAWDAIRRWPKAFAWACLVRVGRLWGLVPHQVAPSESTVRCAARWLVGLWYAGVYLLSVFGLWATGRRLWHRPWLWGVLLCLALTAVHAVYWSNLRMRAPLVPVVCLAMAAGLRRLASTCNAHQRP